MNPSDQPDSLKPISTLSQLVAAGSFTLADEAAMQSLGERVVRLFRGHNLITLSGDLGAGKSVLVRSMIQAMGFEGRVKSPTYTLMEVYEVKSSSAMASQWPDQERVQLAHLDLYRLADPEELDYLGFADLLDTCQLIMVEWPEKGEGRLPVADLHIDIAYLPNGGREVRFSVPCV